MARNLTVNNTTYKYPEQGEDPKWGENAVDWAEAVTSVLATVIGAGDILSSSFTVANNISSDTAVTNLAFDPSTVRSAIVEYDIHRVTDSSTSGNSESGLILLEYDTNASSGNKWLMTQFSNGNAGVTFDMGDDGQMDYQSTNISGSNYAGSMHFRARTYQQ
jgi:hypothetical protein